MSFYNVLVYSFEKCRFSSEVAPDHKPSPLIENQSLSSVPLDYMKIHEQSMVKNNNLKEQTLLSEKHYSIKCYNKRNYISLLSGRI